MSQSTNQNQNSYFSNFGDHFSAKIASLLQDLTGLPSTFSRDNFTHGSWKNTGNNQKICNEDNKASSQEDGQKIGDKAFEIPVKKYPRWASSLTNSLPSDTERRAEASQNSCKINRSSNSSCWRELVLGNQFSKAEVEDYKRLRDNIGMLQIGLYFLYSLFLLSIIRILMELLETETWSNYRSFQFYGIS